MSDEQAVLDANEAFYTAFRDRDMAAMEEIWAAEAPVCCIHPGWAPLIGRTPVIESWAAILSDPGAPEIDSYEKLIKSLLADKQCLVKDTCCEDFGKEMEKQQSLVKAGFLAGVCEAMVKLGTGFLEAQLNALDTDTGKGETMTLSTKACPLFDINGNQFIDRMGAKSSPCNWNLTIKIGGKPQAMNATFWATRQQ